MAARLPVIATSVGGTPEIIESGVTGLLVSPADPRALSAAILQLLNDKELRRRLADAGQTFVVERFSFERLISSLEALYAESPKPASAGHTLEHNRDGSAVKVRLAAHASE
jgi:glycosyltransferase involved in cell wall biosynthesis